MEALWLTGKAMPEHGEKTMFSPWLMRQMKAVDLKAFEGIWFAIVDLVLSRDSGCWE